MNGLAADYEGRATVVQLDAALPENEALMSQYALRGHPTFAVLDAAGEVNARFIGPQDAESLDAALAAVAAAP